MQSSTATYDITGFASLAVDGNTNGNWSSKSVTHTNFDANAWWQVNLGGAHKVNQVRIWNRTDCCSERLTNFRIELLGASGNVIASQTHAGIAGTMTDINITSKEAHSVRIQLNGTNILSLAEVEVFGQASSVGTGLLAQYFNETTPSGTPVLQRIETPDINWGIDSPSTNIPADNFSVRWSGWVEATSTGVTQIRTVSDDGIRVWINNQLVINNWTIHPPTINTAPVTMTAGQLYRITVEYYEASGGAVAQLQWLPANTSTYMTIPTTQLYAAEALQ